MESRAGPERLGALSKSFRLGPYAHRGLKVMKLAERGARAPTFAPLILENILPAALPALHLTAQGIWDLEDAANQVQGQHASRC